MFKMKMNQYKVFLRYRTAMGIRESHVATFATQDEATKCRVATRRRAAEHILRECADAFGGDSNEWCTSPGEWRPLVEGDHAWPTQRIAVDVVVRPTVAGRGWTTETVRNFGTYWYAERRYDPAVLRIQVLLCSREIGHRDPAGHWRDAIAAAVVRAARERLGADDNRRVAANVGVFLGSDSISARWEGGRQAEVPLIEIEARVRNVVENPEVWREADLAALALQATA
jgi:hypothetical protein